MVVVVRLMIFVLVPVWLPPSWCPQTPYGWTLDLALFRSSKGAAGAAGQRLVRWDVDGANGIDLAQGHPARSFSSVRRRVEAKVPSEIPDCHE